MKRLTERKTNYPKCDKQGNLTKVDYIAIKDKKLAEEKLCQLEDIEDELGIDLITLFKAFKIIKEKQVDIRWCGGLPPTLQNTYAITQEEIDLLKEVLL